DHNEFQDFNHNTNFTTVYNAINPNHTTWSTLLPTIQSHFADPSLEIVSLPEWINDLKESANGTQDLNLNPAIRLLDFYKNLAKDPSHANTVFDTTKTVNTSRRLGALEAVKPEWPDAKPKPLATSFKGQLHQDKKGDGVMSRAKRGYRTNSSFFLGLRSIKPFLTTHCAHRGAMEAVAAIGVIAGVDTIAGTFLLGIKRLRTWYQTAKTYDKTVDQDLLHATVQVTRLQIWGERLEPASCPAAASKLFPAILDRAQGLIGEIAGILELYTSGNEHEGVPREVNFLVERFSKLEFKTKTKFATADHKKFDYSLRALQSLIGDLAEQVTFLHQLAPPDQRNTMALELQNSIVQGTEDSAELQKIAKIHRDFISQDIAWSAGFKSSLLNQSWRQPQRLRKFEYETKDLSVVQDWDGMETAELDSQQVLVEWRPKSRVLSRKETTRRIMDIVGLLHEANMTKPKTLLVPDCTGYIDRTDYGGEQRCVGIIYNYPRTLTTNQPYSLYDVLSPKEIKYREAPPLEIRQGIARSLALTIYQIHVTGWLHKGIRPHSLIFFDAKEKDPSLISIQAVQRLRLIGFDYSRPDTLDQ
ncbi:MAG: hypothetical protein Q9226_009072, partial [Calogaya cf. arnoldii]